jgi:Fe-S-cluster containining protein
LKSEAETISRITSKTIEDFTRKTADHKLYAYEMKKTDIQGKCVFLKDKTCTIYPWRPLICRFYPFQLRTARTRHSTFSCTEECPGVRKGAQLGKSYFEALFEEAKDRLAAQSSQT